MRASDPTGLHRVLDDRVVLPQAAERLDTRKELWPDEVRIRVERMPAEPRLVVESMVSGPVTLLLFPSDKTTRRRALVESEGYAAISLPAA